MAQKLAQALKSYNPDQPRGAHGEFGSDGQSAQSAAQSAQKKSLLSQASDLDQEAADIQSTIKSLKKEQASYLAQAKAAEASSSSSSSSTSSTSTSPTVTGTAAGSTSATSAAASTATTAAQYEADAAAVGKQITTLQIKVNSLHAQANQLRAQAAGIKSDGTDSRLLSGIRQDLGQSVPNQNYIPKSTRRSVAATLTDQQEASFSFPILKTETTADGDLLVYGKATDGTVDTDDQIVDPGWSSKALTDWLSTGANLRVQHNPHRDPAGIGLQIDADRDGDGSHYLKALVVEPTAKKLVSKGALRAFSVGIMRPRIVTDMKARGGRIVDGELGEVSLVDRPANRNCTFTLVKADKKGRAEWLGALNSDPDFLAKSLTPSPADVARMIGKRAVEPGPSRPNVQQSEIPTYFADPVANRLQEALRLEKRDLPGGGNVDSGGQDRSDMPRKDFAGPNGTFPIESQGDVSDAASLAHHADNPSAVRSRIRSIARRKWPDMKLPPSLDGDGDDKSAEADLEKAGMKACPNCGKNYHADSKMSKCENCGHKLPVVKADSECSTCHGSGKIREGHMKCPDCGGSGVMKGVSNFGDKKAPAFGSDEDEEDDNEKVAKGHDQDMGDRMQEDDDNSGEGDGDNDDDGQDTSDDDGVGEEDNIKQAVPTTGKLFCPSCGSKVKKSGNFCPGCGAKLAMPDKTKHVIPHSHPSPGDNVRGKKTKPVAPHREPDGPQTEDFEADSGMQDGDAKGGKPPEPSPTWTKARGSTDPSTGVAHTPGTTEGPNPGSEEMRPEEEYEVGHGEEDNRPSSPDGMAQYANMKMRVTEAPYTIMRMHDALCAAYDGFDVLAEYPSLKTFADAVDAESWRELAKNVVAEGNLHLGQSALAVANAAEALKAMDPAAVEDGRALLRKDFTSMYPNVHLSPGQITAQQFNRPYISEGHAPLSAAPMGSQPSAPTPPAPPSASQFTRGPLTEGHESPSPGNGGNRPASFAQPSMGSLSAPKGDASAAIAVIHDHIVNEWPDLCTMSTTYVQPAAKNGIDATSGAGSQIANQIRRHQQRQQAQAGPQNITKGEGLVPVTKKQIGKVAGSGLTEKALKNVLAAELSKATATLTDTINNYREQNEMLVKQVGDLQHQVDILGSQPDPNQAPIRSVTAYPPNLESGAVAQDRRSLVDEMGEKIRAEKMQFLKSLANSGDPVVREGAQAQIQKLLMAP